MKKLMAMLLLAGSIQGVYAQKTENHAAMTFATAEGACKWKATRCWRHAHFAAGR